MKNLFSIGEVSKQQNISRQALIFYDKIGLFCPAYTDPDNGYRYYSASQLDYLDTICILKKIGFSLDEIKAHMQNYTIDHSILALRKQLAAIERQIEELQMIKSRVEHRCSTLEHAVSIRDDGDAVTIENMKNQYLLVHPVRAPYTLEQVGIATKECFARSFKEELPIFFQSGAIVPLDHILQGRYTEASSVFLPIEKTSQRRWGCGAAGRPVRLHLSHRRLRFDRQLLQADSELLPTERAAHSFRLLRICHQRLSLHRRRKRVHH